MRIKMECQRTHNSKKCSCTYPGCPRKGLCCECISYHLKNKELPGCCFTPESEKTYNRSFEKFAEMLNGK